MASVRFKNLSRSFGMVPAVRELSLDVPDGSLLCLVGPSGCGKTTTLRMVAGLETPDTGEIWLGDRDITRLEPRSRQIGMMFQGFALYPHMTVGENIGYPLKVRGVARAERDKRTAEVAKLLDIEALVGRSVQQISGGQQQRVALARAIIQRPQLYLLDEPISSLDAVLRSTMRGEIKRLQKLLSTAMIVVTHDQLDALSMADTIAVMKDGVLQQLGTPDDVYSRPANTFVAGFVGEPRMNLLPATVERRNGLLGVRAGEHWLAASDAARPGLEKAKADQVTVGIRPPAVRVHRTAGPDRIPAKVYVAEPEGSRVIYEFRLINEIFKVESDPELRLQMEEEVFLELRAEALHFFASDGSTGDGRRIA
ncbi:MAG TPA: ABC transporter ATP-binding protein [Candidatus Dormibacteraeota bacterium]|jgi:multiple sugar transport system ATP-binding protein